jgi:outer membrane receptor protein involved in Fe transport
MASLSRWWRATARRRTRVLVAAFASALSLWSVAARAQEQTEESGAAAVDEQNPSEEPAPGEEQQGPGGAPPPPSGVEVIHVKGSAVAQDIEPEVAAAVTRFDAAAIQALGAQNVSDLSKVTPNLEIKTAGATAPTFFIRGVGLSDFAANGSGAVAIYQDGVPRNAPAIQLGQFFDLEGVDVEKGPQGDGSARNASAGAIRIESRKPTGELEAYLRSTFGNYNFKDFEGAIETPLVEDELSTRLAFRFSARDGIGENRCAKIPATQDRFQSGLPFVPPGGVAATQLTGMTVPPLDQRIQDALTAPRPASRAIYNNVSFCGEQVYGQYVDPNSPTNLTSFPFGRRLSSLPGGLPEDVNDMGNWSARGTLRYQPRDTNTDWILGVHGSNLDQQSTLGQAIGTFNSTFGAGTSVGYRDRDIVKVRDRIEAKGGDLNDYARHLARVGDDNPFNGDYNRVGPTRLDTWGAYLNGGWNGDWALGSVQIKSITGYDAYDRYRDTDQDFTPDVLFESQVKDRAWQVSQELGASGELTDFPLPVHWESGLFYLMENLHYFEDQYSRGSTGSALLPQFLTLDYQQKMWSWGAYSGLSWDFLQDFTLEGGFRYNWEDKTLDRSLVQVRSALPPNNIQDTETWQAPTGTISLTYHWSDDVSTYWKYNRGWKGGHLSVLPQITEGVTVAKPETIDAFEVGLKGNWLDGRLSFGGALFYYNYTDYQVLIVKDNVAGPPGIAIVNAHDAEIYGSDVDLRIEPLDNLVFTGHFGWLESQYLDFTNTNLETVRAANGQSKTLVVTVDYTGNRLINSPEFKASGALEYTLDMGRYGSLLPRFDFTWSDDIYFDAAEGRGTPNPTGKAYLPQFVTGQPAFWILNAGLAYRSADGMFEIGGWVRNFMNETYKTYGFDASQFSNVVISYYGLPRTYGLDFTVKF